MAKIFRITIDLPDTNGEDVDSLAADLMEVCETFVDTPYVIKVTQKQGENYFIRDPGDDDLE